MLIYVEKNGDGENFDYASIMRRLVRGRAQMKKKVSNCLQREL